MFHSGRYVRIESITKGEHDYGVRLRGTYRDDGEAFDLFVPYGNCMELAQSVTELVVQITNDLERAAREKCDAPTSGLGATVNSIKTAKAEGDEHLILEVAASPGVVARYKIDALTAMRVGMEMLNFTHPRLSKIVSGNTEEEQLAKDESATVVPLRPLPRKDA